MPFAARCSPSHCELVSAIWPSRSSVPTATISTRTRDDSLSRVVVLPTGVDRQRYGNPDGDEGELQVVAGDRQHAEADPPVLGKGLPLGESARRYRHASLGGARAKDAHPDLAQRDDDG